MPQSWTRASLGEIAEWKGGGTPSKARAEYWTDGSIPWVSPKDMKQETIWGAADLITEAAVSESPVQLIEAGAVLVVTRSGILEHSLPVATTEVPVTVNQDLKAGRPCTGVSARFLAAAMRAYSQEILRDCAKGGTTVASVDLSKLLRFEMPLAPTAEQERVVTALDSYLSRLDSAVATLERVQRNLVRYRASVLKAAVEGRLVPTEASLARAEGRTYEPAQVLLARILAERRRRWEASGKKGKYVEPVGPETAGLPELPEGWCWASVEQLICEPLANGRSVPDGDGAGCPVLRLNCLESGRINLTKRKFGKWSLEEARPFLIQRGDFLVARGNGSIRLVGRGGLVAVQPDEIAFPDTMIRVRIAANVYDPALLSLMWNSPLARRQIEGAARTTAGIYKVSQSDLQRIVLPFAPLQEQLRLRLQLERLASVDQMCESTVLSQLVRLARLRQSVLKWAFTGRLVDQDPSDEPASALLVRIQAERAAGKPARGRSRRK